MATITIDNRSHEVADGQNLLQACLSLGFDIPYFCWHPALHAVGACRQCAVKIFRDETDLKGRIVMSCMTPATTGVRLSIDDPEAREFRARNIEWLMTNHPHDCPVCDEGGECHLQDMTVLTGHLYRRFRFRKRTHVSQDLGPLLHHEMNRCIQCYRCVRFYRDYAGGRDLEVFASASAVYFGRHADGPLESPFSGNLVEVCPTGVFTDRTFKDHYTRKWDLQTAPSVCVHCGVGCNTLPAERYGTLRRVHNRYHGAVNGYFLCDRGRYGYAFVNGPERLRCARLRPESAGNPAERLSPEDVLRSVASWLNPGVRVVGIGSPRASLESNFALRHWVGAEHFCGGLAERDLGLLERIVGLLAHGPAPVPALADVAASDAIFVLGEDVAQTAPRLALACQRALADPPPAALERSRIPRWDAAAVAELLQGRRGPLFVATPSETRLDAWAVTSTRGAPDDLARLGFAVAHAIQADAPAVPGLDGDAAARAAQIARALAAAERPLVVTGTGLGSDAVLQAAANVTAALHSRGKKAALYACTPECNSLGLALLGGMSLKAAVAACESGPAVVVILENDLFRRIAPAWVERLLGAARRVVVLDHTVTRTVARADAVLAAATFAESTGTLVSSEGRAQRHYGVFPPDGAIRASWRWIRDIMAAAGDPRTPPWRTSDDVVSALAAAVPALGGLAGAFPGADFRMHGQRIPRQPHRYSGRTGMTADLDVREPRPPRDPDSPLAFSMEGFPGVPPAALIPRYWAPGWNSVQALGKFQQEIGGPLRGGDPGLRLFAATAARSAYFGNVPPPSAAPEAGQVLAVFLHHLFGSEELSALAPDVAALSPPPSLALNPVDAAPGTPGGGRPVGIIVAGRELRLPVRIDPSLPPGVAGIPAGMAGLAEAELPAWGTVCFATGGKEDVP